MAAITNPTAVAFANQKIRVAADAMLVNYHTCKAIVDAWNAGSISSVLTNTADNVVDGSATDGRNPITGAQATAIITRALEVVADMEASGGAKLNTIALVAVNGQSRI